MLINGNTFENASNVIESDIVIIGAGTVSLYMAARLLKDSPERDICMIESGDCSPTIDSNFDNSLSIGKKHEGTLYGRYSGLGGTSFNWGGQLAEFEQADFERKDSGWPIGYEEMKYYYKEVYSFLGLEKYVPHQYFDDIFCNEPTNKYKIESYYTLRLRSKDTNFSKFFKKEINSNSLKIITRTTAYKINFTKNTAKELLCRSSNGKNISIKANKFIFASGTLGINQFFLSTQALYDVPWRSNNYIGKYFQDHLGGVVGGLRLADEKKFRRLFERRIINGIKIERKTKFQNKYRNGLHNGVVLSFKCKSKKDRHVDRFKLFIREKRNNKKLLNIADFFGDLYKIKGYLFPFIRKLIFDQRIHEDFDDGIEVLVQSEQIPIEESKITIQKDKRLKSGLFKISVDWNWNGNEIEAIHVVTTELKRYLKDQNIADLEIYERIENRDREVLATFRDTNHQCGGMRMSASDINGVVDPNCRVWGTSNVWVAGAAVFPSSSHANSALTALALSEKIIQYSL